MRKQFSTSNEPLLYSPERFAEEINTTPGVVWALINAGALPVVKLLPDERETWRLLPEQVDRLKGHITDAVVSRLQPYMNWSPPPALPAPTPLPAPPKVRERESLLPQESQWSEIIINPKTKDSVYVLHMGPYYKIGYSNRPFVRVANVIGSMPVRPIAIALITTVHAKELEAALHQKFMAVRANGEWFCLEDADIYYLLKLQRVMPKQYLRWGYGYRARGMSENGYSLVEVCDFLVEHRK